MSPNITCLKRNINPNLSNYSDSHLRLCISLQQYSLDLGLSSIEQRNPLALASYRLNASQSSFADCIKALVEQEKLLDPSFVYGKRVFSVPDFKSTLIPEKLYEAEYGREYLDSLFHLNGRECITRESEPNTKSIILTAFNANYLKSAQAVFAQDGQVEFLSVYACLIREVFRMAQTYRRFAYHILLHVREREFDLCVKGDEGLLFLNSFPYPDFDNLLYYFLYAINSLKIDMGSASLFLCGKASEQDLLPRLEDHVYAATYLPAPTGIRFSHEMPYDRYFICL